MVSERKRRQQEITSQLINMFGDVLDDNHSMWLTYCCCSDEDREKRVTEDEKYYYEFLSLIRELVKIVK